MSKHLVIVFLLIIATFAVSGCEKLESFGIFNSFKIDANSKPNLLTKHNEIRIQHGLQPLASDDMLNTVAQNHAEFMAQEDHISHFGKNWSRPSDRVELEGYNYMIIGENIAAGQSSVDEVMKSWMDSSGHKNNILGDYIDIGFGISKGRDGRIYWCVVFGKKF